MGTNSSCWAAMEACLFVIQTRCGAGRSYPKIGNLPTC